MDFLKEFYDTEGPLGLPMKDGQARALEAVLKDVPNDALHAQGTLLIEKATTDLLNGERADISWISTEDIDRYKDVVLASGMNDEHFKLNPIVTLQHSYWTPPVGRSLWRKKVKDGDIKGIKAKTIYPTRPDALPDEAPWLPDEAFPLIQAGLMNGKSIGFLPTKARYPTDPEAAKGIRRVVEEWVLLEYACCYLPCNQQTIVEAVSKGLHVGKTIQKALALTLPEAATASPISSLSLSQVEASIKRRFDSIDFDALVKKSWEEGYARAKGRV